MNQSEATRCGYLLYDSTAVAYALALKLKAPAGAVVALHLPSCVVAVGVKGEKLVFARRYMLSGDDEGALRFGLSSLHQDVQGLKRQGQANPDRIHWVESLVETPVWPKAEYDIPFERLPLSPLDVDGTVQWSALPGIVGRLDPRACLGPKDEIRLLPLERMEKWVWAGLAVLAPALIAGTLLLHGRAGDLERRAEDLRRDNAALRSALQTEASRVAALGGGEFDAAGSRLWAERIRTAGAAPTMAALWDLLAKAKPRGCTVSSLVVNYQGDGVNVRLQGSMDQGVAESQAVFAEFLSRLGQAGFRVNQQALALDGLANAFTIELARPAGN